MNVEPHILPASRAKLLRRRMEQPRRRPRVCPHATGAAPARLEAGGGEVNERLQEYRLRSLPAASNPQSLPGLMGLPAITIIEEIDAVEIVMT